MKEFSFTTTVQGLTCRFNTLVDGDLIAQRTIEYARAHQMEDAIGLFERLPRRDKLDFIFIGVMKSAKARNRFIDELMMQMLLGGDL